MSDNSQIGFPFSMAASKNLSLAFDHFMESIGAPPSSRDGIAEDLGKALWAMSPEERRALAMRDVTVISKVFAEILPAVWNLQGYIATVLNKMPLAATGIGHNSGAEHHPDLSV